MELPMMATKTMIEHAMILEYSLKTRETNTEKVSCNNNNYSKHKHGFFKSKNVYSTKDIYLFSPNDLILYCQKKH